MSSRQPEKDFENARIKIETMVLTSMFLSEIWRKTCQWIDQNPKYLQNPSSFSLLSKEDIIVSLQNKPPLEAIKILDGYTFNIFHQVVQKWYDEQEEKLLEPEPIEKEEIKMRRVFQRYKNLLLLGKSHVKSVDTPVTTIPDQILGGFSTARHIMWQSLGVLSEIYKLKNNQIPSKTELQRLIEGVKPLLLAIANSDVHTLNAIQIMLGKSVDKSLTLEMLSGIDILKKDFKPEKFWISKKGNNLYLEIEPEVLEEIKSYLTFLHHDIWQTGCPALAADGKDGKNVVIEMYDWFAKLFKELYIDTHAEFR